MPLALPPLFHVGIVVADMDAAAADFERRWGVPTEGIVEATFESATYRGQTGPLTARYGFIRSGASEVELIEPVSGVSPYADFLEDNGGDGVHHLAYVVDDIDAHLPDGASLLLDTAFGSDGRFVYVEGTATGAAIELIEFPTELKQA